MVGLFTGETRSRYDVSQERARHQRKGLRVKLRIQPPALAALPWEYLYDPRAAEYLCLSRSTPVVRYLELPQPIQPLEVTPSLQVLGMIASPSDLTPLDVTLEKQRIDLAVAGLKAQGLLEWTWLEGQTARDLQRYLRRSPWHVFHFIGHGRYDALRAEGQIALADAVGKTHLFGATDLARLLADHHELRLVLLNSCEGAQGNSDDIFAGTAATLMRRGLPAVVAMQYAITDRAAIEFAQVFYESLADGLPVDGAVSEARKAISVNIANSLEWGTPVLHLRAAEGQLFDMEMLPVDEPRKATPKPVAPPTSPIAFDWVKIPAGEFIMGSDKSKDEDAFDDELPQHRMYLTDYWIAKTPVTVAQFAQFVKATNHKTTAEIEGKAYVYDGGSRWARVEGANWAHPRGPKSDVKQKANHPVTCVSWADAVAFCQWANVRLPTEAEWEKAARSHDGRIYPWGNEAPDETRCNFSMNERDTTPVGNYPKGYSPYGCLDMVGNISEWTSTKGLGNYVDYANKVENSLEGGGSRVARGGSFGNYRKGVRCAARSYHEYGNDFVGIRVAWSPGS
ncbi:MAG: SUMF1/EgtB/PvdO family nonheme iron enzyme [Caldilineaceae bacterium]